MVDENIEKVSIPSLRRLPLYYHYMKILKKRKVDYVSSTKIAEKMNLTPIQVRKDLSITGVKGRARVGFNIKDALEKIEEFMGWKDKKDGILVGCGDLGSALLGYNNFKNYGFEIVAGFDVDEKITGTEIHGKRIFPIDRMENLCKRLHIKVGIICVPSKSAQKVAERMIDSGIEAIWNFAPAALEIPNDIALHQEDMAASLTILFKKHRKNR
ncbi:MAG: redox-sensing transcriptional repressor Rex [Candidatus Mcinerneyibacterium aminivorans]|uniref:Redox-sensing transcriptional repressor Rex n=1 Tax=Candidatus Mcinerneyibacterium aminivorans TaxID=2703815 RepID=A0A5D0MAW1_9BACT|nr:MAG: redox-sensing transcriptional repressor Rex [Candidatus Mcinerneyibacterium aminivorans]